MSGIRRCCNRECGSAAYICIIDEASSEQGHVASVDWYCAEQEYSTDDPPNNEGFIHSLVSTTETGLSAYGGTGYALVGLELCVHVNSGTPAPTMTGTDCTILPAVQITTSASDFSQDIIDEIEARFGDTVVDSNINKHPQRIYFIIDNSGSYELLDFFDTYVSISNHYLNAGFSSKQVIEKFGGANPCCGASISGNGENVLLINEMLPIESWFYACTLRMKDHTAWVP
tara:strand:+ start:338 stop:1024 length:687 start_codon:yes stop_codon:yes gene_type:complete